MISNSEAQSTEMEFGQNRVQFHDFYWSLYESENFITYYYPGGQQIGRFTLKVAEDLLKEIEEFYDYRINKKINILVYTDITDLGQTNIGIEREVYNSGGTTQIIENKMFVYFDGDHQNLYNSIKEGIANVVIEAMMFGGNFVEILQNAVLLNLPEWYKPGLAAYTAEEWNVDLDNQLRKYFHTAKKPSFDDLALTQPKLAGHSFWYYIDEIYGKEAISEILYLTRVNRNVSSGLFFTIDLTLEQVIANWFDYYNAGFTADQSRTKVDSTGEAIKLKMRNNTQPSTVKISPDGSHIAYAVQDDGRFKVFVLDIESGKAKKIVKGGFKSDSYPHDDSYPLIAWSPTGNQLFTFYEKKDKLRYLTYEPEDQIKEKNNLLNFQRVYSVEYIGAKTIVMSAQRAGQTDIFTHYLPSSRTTQITNDFYDDLYAGHANLDGNEGIIFSSNRHTDTLKRERQDSILPIGNLDLFFYNLETKDPALVRLTNTPFSDEKFGRQLTPETYGYLSAENGIINIMEGYIDSVYLGEKQLKHLDGQVYWPQNIADSIEVDSITTYDDFKFVGVNNQRTNFTYNIKEWDVALKKKQVLVISDQPKGKREKTYAHIISINQLRARNNSTTTYKKNWEAKNRALIEALDMDDGEAIPYEEKGVDTIYEGNFDYTFQSEFDIFLQPKKKEAPATTTIVKGNSLIKTISNDVKFISSQVIPYRAKFTSDFIVTQLDNSTNITGYERFGNNSSFDFGSANSGNGGGVGAVSNASGINNLTGFINYGITDIMEDHRLVAGFKIPTDFDGTELYTAYNNLKRRFDWRLLFYRKTDKQIFAYPDGLFSGVPTNIPGQSPLPLGIDLPNLVANPSGFIFVNPLLGLSGKLKTHYAEASVSFPIDIIRSVKVHAGYRNEKVILQSLDTVGLAFPTYTENWSLLKGEFVHDNTKSLATNIRTGLRFKVFTEFHRNWSTKENIFVTGFDVRHYQKLYKTIIWANRVAYASSYGPQKVFYYLGGIDGQLNPKFDSRTPIDYTQNYGFQAGAVNMRGFAQNIRNGNSFALWNSELRVPIFSAFIKRPIKLSFIRDFQIIGFFDAGLAYKGIAPWDDENAFDVTTIGQPPLEVEVNFYRRPTVFGMGTGFRTSILGYFLRVDVGWGKDGSDVKPDPIWHISFSKDF
ncbi:MAG: hypothetical protein R2730_03130 [Chitinophagales bacterium]